MSEINPRLPQADPWDRRTGAQHLMDVSVDCFWEPVNEEWASVNAYINLHDGRYALSKPAEVFRVRRTVNGKPVESPEMSAIAWTKKMLGSGGVPVLGLHERTPGHIHISSINSWNFRWWAGVASRLSVAVVRLGGDLEGQARLTLVE